MEANSDKPPVEWIGKALYSLEHLQGMNHETVQTPKQEDTVSLASSFQLFLVPLNYSYALRLAVSIKQLKSGVFGGTVCNSRGRAEGSTDFERGWGKVEEVVLRKFGLLINRRPCFL